MNAEDESELGGESACFAHLLDDEGRVVVPAVVAEEQTAGQPS